MDENKVNEIEEEEDWRPAIRFEDDEEDAAEAVSEVIEEAEETVENAVEDAAGEAQPVIEEPKPDTSRRAVRGEKKKTSIGGQALIEGVMMRGPHRTTMAVRTPDGKIVTEDVSVGKSHDIIKKIPIIRGVFSFIDSMKVGTSTITRSAELAGFDEEEEPSEFEKKLEKALGGKLFDLLMVVATVLGIGLAVLLFLWLPAKCYEGLGWLSDRFIPESGFNFTVFDDASPWKNVIRSAFEGVFKIIIFIIYILLISRMKDIRRVFEYHGAEHKSIFCYENGDELTVENARKYKRFHPRCGTSFLILMLLLSIIVGMFIQTDTAWLRVLIRLACIPIIMGVGYELLKFCGRHDNFLTRIIAAPGMWMQRLTTKEPDDSQLECAIEALLAVIPENQEDDRW